MADYFQPGTAYLNPINKVLFIMIMTIWVLMYINHVKKFVFSINCTILKCSCFLAC
jgi:hypothetical protein